LFVFLKIGKTFFLFFLVSAQPIKQSPAEAPLFPPSGRRKPLPLLSPAHWQPSVA
jgi:hypothetical protein